MDLRYRRGAFSYRTTHAFDGTRTDVADGEHAWNAGLESRRLKPLAQRPQGVAREHKAMRIDCHAAALQPACFGIRTDEQEHMAKRLFFFGARPSVAP